MATNLTSLLLFIVLLVSQETPTSGFLPPVPRILHRPVRHSLPLRCENEDGRGNGEEREGAESIFDRAGKSRYESFYKNAADSQAIDVESTTLKVEKQTNPFFVGYSDAELAGVWAVHEKHYGARPEEERRVLPTLGDMPIFGAPMMEEKAELEEEEEEEEKELEGVRFLCSSVENPASNFDVVVDPDVHWDDFISILEKEAGGRVAFEYDAGEGRRSVGSEEDFEGMWDDVQQKKVC
ncbi:hypothetical protein GUITHDRAFT_112366 [Guillardia theta CCMP2712]|uniref:Uncharacterized protein n=1 Tax=Guillardia theta (strain CCMP2712) TaxID=905079 RepID=L1J0P1_GUITC|nr:hypothetical protein GUITHDRAFT_112366 [Guillardia theta CCMP2712]EKX41660.1 hypothetical protein GUITHDRAFT_112366 [Guillardia theta CCMP2712]|eukprot:XP_005828640.1 hypothetical protein GUITHDRAFT_112366 [Guillardia theta CCMP2712]